MKKLPFLLLLFAVAHPIVRGQQTLGLFLNDSLSFNGYTLFAPSSYETTYLIDNCGYLVKSWTSDNRPGMSAYLLENGDLLRAARITSNFNSGGSGGRVERFDWDGNLLWGYDYSSNTYHQHHDITPMPNGNVLLVAWEWHSQQEAIAAGRNPNTVPAIGLWSERIVELVPVGTNEANVVWEWRLWDHLVQQYSADKPNYGTIAEHPELIDLNFFGGVGAGPGQQDWIHANSLDYNAETDQILLSSRVFSEIWTIDHSTTIQEAAGHSGGKWGKGGDILYRWGNPQAYDRGSAADRRFFGQHDAHWIPKGLPGEGDIMVFNNGTNRPGGNFSSIDVITPPVDANGNYVLETGQAYGPSGLTWSYVANPPTSFYSPNVSGAQRQPNGNTLICEGQPGHFFEVTPSGKVVWDYVNPVRATGPATQGQTPNGNSVFRIYRYASDYPAFEGKDLTPGAPVEKNPLPSTCQIFEEINTASQQVADLQGISLFPNPVGGQFFIENKMGETLSVNITDLSGRVVFSKKSSEPVAVIETAHWHKGLYLVHLSSLEKGWIGTKKIVKL
jgi:hypothetical protein